MDKYKEINQYNEQGKKHGYWEYYYYNSELDSKGNYINGLKEGYWIDCWDNFYHPFFFKYGKRYYKNRNLDVRFETF